MSKILCLDFDGVLCDSIDECLLTSYNAYFEKYFDKIEKINQKFKNYFYEYRYFVRPAGEYLIIYKAFEENI